MQLPSINICMGSSCFSRGNEQNLAIIEEFLFEHGLSDEVDVELGCSICKEQCSKGPNIVFNGKLYSHVDASLMLKLLTENLKNES
ncbi:(2Fe-2S) ferredoxin domain-containing protein [Lentisphaerota bacterium WC36G]|nr:(2Fe-2S) ferredoxin domain-containing protein [Lentisphaerae bacterium WC36]